MSADVHQILLEKIVKAEIVPGQRLKDSELAQELGVSRTPIREALLRLEKEGFISSQKHLGFSVKRLQESEIRDVYPLIRLLECSALGGCPLPGPEKLSKLQEIAVEMRRENLEPLRRIELDMAWHKSLIEGHGNQQLTRMLADLKRILLRYEYAFMRDDALVAESASEHDAIIGSLELGRLREAIDLLGSHWLRCADDTLRDFLGDGRGGSARAGESRLRPGQAASML